MNTLKGKAKFNFFQILLYSGCSSTIVLGILVEKLYPGKDAQMQWHTHVGNITTYLMIKLDFTLTTHSATNAVTWICHVDESAKGRYNMILGRDILTEL